VTTTVADQVVERVEALMRTEGVRTRAEAIRRVAAEMDRSVSATSSAFYAGRRSAAEAGDQTGAAPRRAQADRNRLYAEMLPLVEAGATIEQAARRFGDDEDADEIAAGFARWILAERSGGGEGGELAEARRQITALEAELRSLRRDLTRAHQALSRVRALVGDALGEPQGR